MKRVHIIRIVMITMLLSLIHIDANAEEITPTLDWYIRNLDQSTTSWYITEHSLKIDANDHIHLVYIDSNESNHLKHAWYDGTTWFSEVVDEAGGSNPTLTFDSADNLHVVYMGSNGLKHAHKTANGWDIETFEIGGWSPSSIAMDVTYRPHTCYVVNDTTPTGEYYDINYAVWTGSDWDVQTLQQSPYSSSCSLALDSSGSPHIAYTIIGLYAKDVIKYARLTEAGWDIQTIQESIPWNVWGVTFSLKDILLDSSDSPQIFYNHNEAGHPPQLCLNETRWTIAGWETYRLSCQMAGISLVQDLDKSPHLLTSHTYMFTSIAFIYWADNSWNYQTLDTNTKTESLSLAFDTHNHASAIYYDSERKILKLAQRLPALHLDLEATPKRDLSPHDTFTYTIKPSGPAGHNVLLWDPLPDNVEYISGTISASAIYSPAIHTVLWQGSLPTNTLPIISFQVTLTNTDSLSSSLPAILNTVWLTDTEYGNNTQAFILVNGVQTYLPLTMNE